MQIDDFGQRIKGYESNSELLLDKDKYVIIRVDGHKFSNYTQGFEKPYDALLSQLFIETTIELMKQFQAVTGYTQSDEITIIIPPENLMFSGRTQKTASLVGSFTTMSFNRLLNQHILEFINNAMINEIDNDRVRFLQSKNLGAWFDARVFNVPSKIEAFNSILWRVHDAKKNSKSMFAQKYCSHKELENLTGNEKIELAEKTTQNKWIDTPNGFKFGSLVKKEIFTINGSSRSKFVVWSENLQYSDNNVEIITNKYKHTNKG